jgi:hypothetical protein
MRPPVFRGLFLDPRELVVDSFAGGGGASTGIEAALGRPVDIAINHDPEAIAMHAANHPETRHFCENIWEVDPPRHAQVVRSGSRGSRRIAPTSRGPRAPSPSRRRSGASRGS